MFPICEAQFLLRLAGRPLAVEKEDTDIISDDKTDAGRS